MGSLTRSRGAVDHSVYWQTWPDHVRHGVLEIEGVAATYCGAPLPAGRIGREPATVHICLNCYLVAWAREINQLH